MHTHICLCQDSVFQLKQLCPHQAVASTQVALSLCHPARVTPACPSFNSSADAHGKPGSSWGKGKLLIQLNAGAWGRCLWRLVVRPGLPADWAELSSLPPVYFFKWHRAPLYFPVRLVKLMSGNDSYWFDRLPRACRSALTTESYLITTKRWRISGNLKDLSQGIWIRINAENMSSSAKLHHSFLTVKIVILKSSRSYRKQPSARWSYRDALSHLKWKTHCSWTSHTWTFPRRGSSTSKLTSRLCMFLISHLTGKHTILSPGVLTRPGLRSTWTDRGGQGGWHPLWGMFKPLSPAIYSYYLNPVNINKSSDQLLPEQPGNDSWSLFEKLHSMDRERKKKTTHTLLWKHGLISSPFPSKAVFQTLLLFCQLSK